MSDALRSRAARRADRRGLRHDPSTNCGRRSAGRFNGFCSRGAELDDAENMAMQPPNNGVNSGAGADVAASADSGRVTRVRNIGLTGPSWATLFVVAAFEIMAAKVAAVPRGIDSYYTSKVDELEVQLREKLQNLRRLEAQRNELNSRGGGPTAGAHTGCAQWLGCLGASHRAARRGRVALSSCCAVVRYSTCVACLSWTVRALREELMWLHEPGSYVGEVVKVMGKDKVRPRGRHPCVQWGPSR